MKLALCDYDKPHRCPGWSGAGWKYNKKDWCDDTIPDGMTRWGTPTLYDKKLWYARINKTNCCGTYVLPHFLIWFSPTKHKLAYGRIRSKIWYKIDEIKWKLKANKFASKIRKLDTPYTLEELFNKDRILTGELPDDLSLFLTFNLEAEEEYLAAFEYIRQHLDNTNIETETLVVWSFIGCRLGIPHTDLAKIVSETNSVLGSGGSSEADEENKGIGQNKASIELARDLYNLFSTNYLPTREAPWEDAYRLLLAQVDKDVILEMLQTRTLETAPVF